LVVALVVLVGSAVDDAALPGSPEGCAAPAELVSIGPALTHIAARIEAGQPITIVAIGSSSTQGVGASVPALSYPARLEAELRKRLPDTLMRVVNRGKGGEEAPQMLARMERDVIAEHPDLVVWQLGTNAVLHHDDVAFEEGFIEHGVARLKSAGGDVVLMDMQYAPRVLARPAYAAMERLLADAAKRERVGLFQRFAIMRYWHVAERDGPPMVGSDGLHMNDRGYGCLAADLAEAIADNARVRQAAQYAPAALVHLPSPVEVNVP
jgi:lysophospholipase L1-like esterase